MQIPNAFIEHCVFDVKTWSCYISAPFWSWDFIYGHNVLYYLLTKFSALTKQGKKQNIRIIRINFKYTMGVQEHVCNAKHFDIKSRFAEGARDRIVRYGYLQTIEAPNPRKTRTKQKRCDPPSRDANISSSV